MSDRDAFYIKLKTKLEETTTFPTKYLYKFIVPSNGDQVQQVKDTKPNYKSTKQVLLRTNLG